MPRQRYVWVPAPPIFIKDEKAEIFLQYIDDGNYKCMGSFPISA